MPGLRSVGRMEKTVVVHGPHHVWVRRVLNDDMWILHVRVVGQLGWNVRGPHAVGMICPTIAAVFADPHASARDTRNHTGRRAWMHQHGVNPGIVVTPAHPFLAGFLVPQRFDKRPVVATIVAMKQTSWNGAAPQSTDCLEFDPIAHAYDVAEILLSALKAYLAGVTQRTHCFR